MFVIEGMAKVRKVIEENRKRKLTKHKKISNNTIIEMDHCSPLDDPEAAEEPDADCGRRRGSDSFTGKGKHKPEIQRSTRNWKNAGPA